MTRTFVGEFTKIRTTGMVLGILGVAVGLSLLSLLLGGGGVAKGYYSSVANQRALVGAAGWAGTAAMLLGAIGMTSEERHKTLTPSLLAVPNRAVFVLGKALAYAVTGAVMALVTLIACVPAFWFRVNDAGAKILLSGGDWVGLTLGVMIYAALASIIGVGLGCIVRNQIALVAGILIWFIILEALLLVQTQSLAKYTPGGLGAAIGGPGAVGVSAYTVQGLAIGAAIGAYLVYVVVILGGGVVALRRRDVS